MAPATLAKRTGWARDASRLMPLLLLVGGTALLPRPASWPLLLGVVILGGVPHGALDGEVARPLFRPRWGRAWFPVFALPYLALSALVLLLWRAAPLWTLAGFLLLSVLHFGENEAEPGPGTSPARYWRDRLVRGGAPIALPTLFHPAATAHLLGTAALLPLHAPPAWLWLGAGAWLCLAGAALVADGTRGSSALARDLLVPAAAFLVLPPLAAFTFYFVGLHAPAHMRALAGDTRRAPRVRTVGEAAVRSVPVTLLTLLLGAALWPLFPGAAPDRLLALTLQSLAALTLPHMLLDALVSRRLTARSVPHRQARGALTPA
jgi:beta-carotene 15,15'-dioxygenase